VPEEESETLNVTSPEVPPPVRPLPVLTAVMSPELADEDDMVIVEPVWATDVPPDPASVSTPERSLTLVTSSVESRLTTGFWPPVTAMPSPPETE